MAGGSVVGPLATGFLVGHLGYAIAFLALAIVAAAAAFVFVHEVPETSPADVRAGAR